jgi:RNA polymerase sigma-70 factor (ECF subfamily)
MPVVSCPFPSSSRTPDRTESFPPPDGPDAEADLPLTAEAVFQEHAGRVYGLAWRMLLNEADAEDVAQEVMLQVVRKLDSFRHESEFSTWLHRVTVNAALVHRRKCARRPERQLPDVPEDVLSAGQPYSRRQTWPPAPDQAVLDRETQHLIQRAIASLPPIYRDVYVLADVEGLPNAEIGALLQLGLAAVKSRLHRARLLLRDALAPHFQEVAVG